MFCCVVKWQFGDSAQRMLRDRTYRRQHIATAKAVRTAQRLKSPLVLQSPPTRTQIQSVLTDVATAVASIV